MNTPKLCTLDNDTASRDTLSLTAIEAAGRRDTPLGLAARAAYQEYQRLTSDGVPHETAMLRARDEMLGNLPTRG